MNKTIHFVLLLSLLFVSCRKQETIPEEPKPIDVSSIEISPSEASLRVGETIDYTTSYKPENANFYVDSCKWTTSDEDIVMMVSPGVFKARSRGMAVVTMRYKSLKASSKVVVSNIEIKEITLSQADFTMKVEESHRLSYSISPDNATDQSVVWRSLDESVATVSPSGLVTAVGEGSTEIIVASVENSEINARCKVTVQLPPPMDFDIEKYFFGGEVTQVEFQDNIRAELKSKTLGQEIVSFTVKSLDQSIIGVRRDGLGCIEISGLAVGKTEIEITVDDKYGRSITKTFPIEVKMLLPQFHVSKTAAPNGGGYTVFGPRGKTTMHGVQITLSKSGPDVWVNAISVVEKISDDVYRSYGYMPVAKSIGKDAEVNYIATFDDLIYPSLRVELIKGGQWFYLYIPLNGRPHTLVEGPMVKN